MNAGSSERSLQQLRMLFYTVVAAFEATRAYLVVLLLAALFGPARVYWPALVAVVGLGAVSTRWRPAEDEKHRWQHAVVALGVALWATKWQALGGILPWQGWGTIGAAEAGGIYSILLTTLWCWWRGLALPDHDHSTLVHTLRRTVLTVVVLGLLIGVVRAFQSSTAQEDQSLLIAAVGMFGLALISLVLARLVADAEAGVVTNRWRWLRSGVGVTLLLLFIGMGVLAIFSSTAANVLRALLLAIIVVLLIIATPLVWILSPIGSWIAGHMRPSAALPQTPPVPPIELLPASPAVLRYVLQVPLYLIILLPPLIMLLAIIFFQRRRKRIDVRGDESHESLFSWDAVGQDVRDLFARRRSGGLKALLASLRSSDPATRIRRRYIQALLLGEAAERGRREQQTPAEYRPELSAVVPGRDAAVGALTRQYQQARYAPASTSEADAQIADEAWTALAAGRERQP